MLERLLIAIASIALSAPSAADRPRWLGPRRDAISDEAGGDRLAAAPRKAWTARVGAGPSSPAALRGRLHALGREAPAEPAAPAGPAAAAGEGAAPASPAAGPGPWPRFRGPGGLGIGPWDDVPVAFDGKSGKGIDWKAKVPLPGPSSPIVAGGRIFLTGATRTRRELMAFEAASGAIAWRREVRPDGSVEPDPEDKLVWAAPTPASDGERVFAVFGNGDLAAIALDGSPVWARSLGKPENAYGHGSSLEVARGKLIVQLDQGNDEDGKSRLLAIDPATGRTVWEARRPALPASWSTPIAIEAGGRAQVIACGGSWTVAHDLATGAEAWRAKCLGGEVVPSPVFSEGLVFAVAVDGFLAAIRPEGSGDVTKTGIAWKIEEDLPATSSPIAAGGLVVVSSSGGLVTCREAATGKKLWEKDYETSFEASPVLAGGIIRMIDEEGVLRAFRLGRTFEEAGRSELGEPVQASPALAPGRIYLRGKENLYAIGTGAPE